MKNFELVITEATGEPYWTQEFDTKAELNRWLETEKTRFYWKKNFVVKVNDNSAEVERQRQAYKEALEAEEKVEKQKRQEMKAAVKAFREKPSKTVADIAKLLDVIVDALGIKPDEPADKRA